MTAPDRIDDERAIAQLVDVFFEAFTSGPGVAERIDALRAVLLPQAVIARGATTYDVEGFLAPRQELLTAGTLTDFREWEVEGTTTVFGDVAQHTCTYQKSWYARGLHHEGSGWKSMHLVRTATGWRISAVVWDDMP